MSNWQPIETAPKDAWVIARSGPGAEPVAVISDEEDFFWEDETGDYLAEYRALRHDGGLKEWSPAPEGWMPHGVGTNRAHEPVYSAAA